MTDIMEQQPKALRPAKNEKLPSMHVESNLKRNYISYFLHGMLGLTGFRLIYAPTFIPAYVQMLTGSTVMVDLASHCCNSAQLSPP